MQKREEKGSISTLALFTVLMFLAILMGVYLITTALLQSQIQSNLRIQEIYGQEVTQVEDIYSEIVESMEKNKVANKPDISGFNKSTTYYVTWDLTNSPYKINDNISLNEKEPSNWYDYTAKVNQWANIKTTGGGNTCYWVWIPRYAYQVPNRESGGEEINIKFLNGTSNIPIGGTKNDEITNKTPTQGSWVVHPAFWWDKDNDGIEDDGEQLTGIWVAKFEASSSTATNLENLTEEEIKTAIANNGGGDINSLQVRVIPNVTSWREITVSNIFTVCRNLTEEGNSLVGSMNLYSHMMKNVEWGAAAYLSRSIYGKNGPVWNNPYYSDAINNSSITGLAADSQDASQTDLSNTYRYNEVGGGNASTTGNVYGIYDMAGGAWEVVAGYLSAVLDGDATLRSSSQNLYDADLKYKDIYVGNNADSNENYLLNTKKYGDATYETSTKGASSSATSWDSDDSWFASKTYPIFSRGGHANYGIKSGIFAFNCSRGLSDNIINSFRPCLVSLQQ